MSGLRAFSYGGGVQSTAALVLAAQEKIDYRVFLFANVGDDSESPATIRYVREVAMPFARAHGIELHELHRVRRDGTTETLYGRLTKEGSRSLPIPVRMSNGAPGTRSCTADFKIRVIGKWLKRHGASAANPATVGVGISLDEIERVNVRRSEPYERLAYPLIGVPGEEDTGFRLRRSDCAQIISGGGASRAAEVGVFLLPLPPPGDLARAAPVGAGPVREVLRPGGPAQRAARRTRQGPCVFHPVRPAAARRHPRRRRPAAHLRRQRHPLRQRVVHDMSTIRMPAEVKPGGLGGHCQSSGRGR